MNTAVPIRNSVPPPSRRSVDDIADYLVEIGSTLVSYGCPSYRVEDVVRAVAQLEGFRGDAFCFPTGLFVHLVPPDGSPPVQRMARVRDWSLNLQSLAFIDGVFNDVAARRCSLVDAKQRLRDIALMPSPYSEGQQILASVACSGAAAVFFRGGPREVVVAAFAGLATSIVGRILSDMPTARFLVDFMGAFLCGLLAWGVSHFADGISREVVILAGVITLIPGMTLTTGLGELAQKNLVSGGGRLMETLITFVSIVFGIAFAIGLEQMAGHASAGAAAQVRHGLSLPFQALALVAASMGFAIRFSIPRSYLWAALLSGATGYVVTSLATRSLPGHVAAFVAAVAVCVCANLFARATQRPAQLFQVPGMMLLVPGSFGFLSLEAFLRGEFLGGAAKGFEMLLVAGALVTGILVANVLLPARKLL